MNPTIIKNCDGPYIEYTHPVGQKQNRELLEEYLDGSWKGAETKVHYQLVENQYQ